MEIPLVCFLQDSYDKVEDLQVRDAAAFFVLIERVRSKVAPAPKVQEVVNLLARMVLESRDVLADDFLSRYTDYRVGADGVSTVMQIYDDYFKTLDSKDKWRNFFASHQDQNHLEFVRSAMLDFYAEAAPGLFGESGLKAIFGPTHQRNDVLDVEDEEEDDYDTPEGSQVL